MDAIDELFSKARETNSEDSGIVKNSIEKLSDIELGKIKVAPLVISIFLFEILVCIIGAGFYKSMGYGLIEGAVIATTTECFYMWFSSKRSLKSHIIRVVLLCVSVFTLSYSSYIKDENIQKAIYLMKADISDSELRLKEVNVALSNIKVEELRIEKDMEVYREHSLITKGNNRLAPRRKELINKRNSLLGERLQLRNNIKNVGNNLVRQSFFTNLGILDIKTIVSIVAFAVLQLAICIALPDIWDQLKGIKQ